VLIHANHNRSDIWVSPGWPICINPVGLSPMPIKLGSCTKPSPGYQVDVMGEDGKPLPRGRDNMGELVLKLPLPPGCATTLYENDDLYQKAYLDAYPGYYRTGDEGYIDEEGYVFVMSRVDDVINVAGHRFSTGAFEEVAQTVSSVAECAVIGISNHIKGQIPIAFIVLKHGVVTPAIDIEKEVVEKVRSEIGAVASLKDVITVPRLPKTKSGKTLRSTLRKLAQNETIEVIPPTIDDPTTLDDIKVTLQRYNLFEKTKIN